MKIKKVRKQEMVTKIFMINQNLKILHTASFFSWAYSLCIINYFTVFLLLFKYCYGLPHILLIEQIRHISILPFLFYGQYSRAIDKKWGSTYHLLQWLSQYTSRVFGKILFSFFAKPKWIQ